MKNDMWIELCEQQIKETEELIKSHPHENQALTKIIVGWEATIEKLKSQAE